MNAMDNEDTSRSEPTDSNSSMSVSLHRRTLPSCGRCRNHDLTIALKGHKKYCKHQKCGCKKCKITVEKRKITAKQTALKRELDLYKTRKKLPEESEPIFSFDEEKPKPLNAEETTFDGEEEPTELILRKKLYRKQIDSQALLKYTLNEMYLRLAAWSLMPGLNPLVPLMMDVVTTILNIEGTDTSFNAAVSRISRASIIHHPKIIYQTILCGM